MIGFWTFAAFSLCAFLCGYFAGRVDQTNRHRAWLRRLPSITISGHRGFRSPSGFARIEGTDDSKPPVELR